MSRRKIDRREALAAMATGAAAGLALIPRSARTETRPNIIFILIDDQRYDAFGFMDKPWLPTPHLDRLAREGAQYTNAFVTTSLCSPSRASFLTGQYACRHGVTNNFTPWQDENVTFLELLHAAGYRTGFIGKWHMPGKGIPDLKGQGKVDRMVSFSFAGGQGIYEDCPLLVDGQKVKRKGYITDVLTDHALEFMDERRDRPFCLYLSHKAVHAFFNPPPRHRGQLKGAPFPKLERPDHDFKLGWVNGQQRLNFDQNIEGYYETLLGVDDSVGRILDGLDAAGAVENTMIVYAGDNGYFWGEHGLVDKRFAYEESMRIPLLMRFPRLVPDGGRRVEDMVLNIDLAPTVLAAAGLEPPPAVQGRSWLEAAQGHDVRGRESFLYEYYFDPGFPTPPIRAVRTREWKYITYPDSKYPDEMYNLKDDPREKANLAANPAQAGRKAELRAEMKRLQAEAGCS